jgi:hypothetical protein
MICNYERETGREGRRERKRNRVTETEKEREERD